MTIKIEVRDVAGVQRADLEIEPGQIALVGGINESGKTSLLEAVTSAIVGQALFRIAKKNQGQELVHEGAKRGHVTVAGTGGSSTVSWPGCEVETTGKEPPAAASSCYIGMTPWSTLEPDLKRNMLISLLEAKPTREHLDAALPDSNPKNVDALWKRIEGDGWDAAHSYVRERIQEAKADWKAVTHEQWGEKKADGWEPKGLDVPRETTLEALQSRLQIATTEHEEAIRRSATSDVRLAQLRQQVAEGDAASAAATELDQAIVAIKAEIDGAKAERDALPEPLIATQPFKCPHCAGDLIMKKVGDQRVISAAPTNQQQSEAERAKLVQQRRDADAKVRGCEARLDVANRDRVAAGMKIDKLPELRAEVEKIEAEGAVEVDIDRAKAALDAASKTLALFQQREKATAMHAKIGRMCAMRDAVASDGVRLKLLRERLDDLNSMLSRRAQGAHFSAVRIEEDMSITYGGRPFYLSSESGKYRANLIIGTALAKLSGAPIYLVDRVDILHAHGRGHLFTMLASLGLPILAAMTVKAADFLPPLHKHGYGKPYWMEAGVLEDAGL